MSWKQPAEWESHEAVWTAWPSHGDLWLENLKPAQKEFAAFCKAVSEGERIEVLVPDAKSEAEAKESLKGLNVNFHRVPFGDIWLRDTAPIFLKDRQSHIQTAAFKFNGWGEKYVLPDDDKVASQIAEKVGLQTSSFDWILEGGSVEVDGEGTCLTTKQCLLNPNRNKGITQSDVEQKLMKALGVQKILWLDEGLLNDHTDGHVDTIARFVAPGLVVCMKPKDETDPNFNVLNDVSQKLKTFSDSKGRKLEVIEIPSPGKVLDEDGEILPASYVNFYIGNSVVVVPTYDTPNDDEAVKSISLLFPNRKTTGLSAKAILSGGGAFHCITQQQPSGKKL